MNTVFLCLGGNLGNREENLKKAIQLLGTRVGSIKQASAVYETSAWGNTNQPAYLNQVLQVQTEQSATEILKSCLDIEHELGRTREKKWENRLIDIDILFFNNEIIDMTGLQVPHPLLSERLFVLEPLNEIAADYVHPVHNKTVNELLQNCSDRLKVVRK